MRSSGATIGSSKTYVLASIHPLIHRKTRKKTVVEHRLISVSCTTPITFVQFGLSKILDTGALDNKKAGNSPPTKVPETEARVSVAANRLKPDKILHRSSDNMTCGQGANCKLRICFCRSVPVPAYIIYFKCIQIRFKTVFLSGFPRSVVKATMVIIYIYKNAHMLQSAIFSAVSR